MTDKKRWYFAKDAGNKKPFFIFVSKQIGGVMSVRSWEADSGIALGVLRNEEAARLVPVLEETGVLLSLKHSPNVAWQCKVRLPGRILAELRAQVSKLED